MKAVAALVLLSAVVFSATGAEEAAAEAVKEADLRQIVLARTDALKGATIALDMSGASRSRFVSADKNFLTAEINGQQQPVPWKMIKIQDLFGIAYQAAASVDELLVVARYAYMNDKEALGEKSLEKALLADASRAADIEKLQKQFKAAPVAKPASTTSSTSSSAGTAPKYPAVPAGPWQCMGPGGGGAMYTPTISPHDPKSALITCDMSGVYLTRDGGRHWRVLPGMRYGHGVAFGADPNTIFVGLSDKLHRSIDGGATWQGVTADRQYPMCKCQDVLVDLDDPRNVWASFGYGGEAGFTSGASNRFLVERSIDGGATFKDASKGFPAGAGMVKRMAIDRNSPAGNRTIFAATTGGFYRSRDAGGNWEKSGSGLPKEDLREVVALWDKGARKTVILVSLEPGGIYRSEDGGSTFTPSGKGLSDKDDGAGFTVEQMACGWSDANTVYAGGSGFGQSLDGGKTWRRLYSDANKLAGWMMVFFPWSHEHSRGVGCNPKNPKQVWFTGDMQLFASDDGGGTFTELNSHPMPEGSPRHSFKEQHHKVPMTAPFNYDGGGLEVTFCYQVIPDPLKQNTYYTCYADIGGWRTEDAGKSWTYNVGIWNVGIKSEWRNSCYEIAVDKRTPGRLVGVFSGLHNLPGPDPAGAGKYNIGGVAVSPDGGKSWTPLDKHGLPERPCTSVLIDRRNDTTYVCVYGVGVFRSTDGCKSFSAFSAGLPKDALAWRLRQTPDNTIFLACALAKPGGIWKLDEGKSSWSRVDGNACADVRDLLVFDAGKENEKFIAAAVEGDDGGVFASDDGGATWKKLHAGKMRGVERTPDGKTWFAGGFGGLFKSVDGGGTWAKVPDFPFGNGVNDVTLNPKNPGELWVGTPGCGVFKGF